MDNFPLNLAHGQLRKAERYEKDNNLQAARNCVQEASFYLKNVLSSTTLEPVAMKSIEAQIREANQYSHRLQLKMHEQETLKHCARQHSGQNHSTEGSLLEKSILYLQDQSKQSELIDELNKTISRLSSCLESIESSLMSGNPLLSQSLREAKDCTSSLEVIADKLSSCTSSDSTMVVKKTVVESESRKVTFSLEVNRKAGLILAGERENCLGNGSAPQNTSGSFDIDFQDIVPLEVPAFDFTVFQSMANKCD